MAANPLSAGAAELVPTVFNAAPRAQRSRQGAFATPGAIAAAMAGWAADALLEADRASARPAAALRLLDPGCGVGLLVCALVDALRARGYTGPVEATLVELNAEYLGAAVRNLDADPGVTVVAHAGDFLAWAARSIAEGAAYDAVIANPPYQKISAASDAGARQRLAAAVSAGPTNEYTASMGAAARLLGPGGVLAYLTPRSHLSGAYFKRHRRDLLGRLRLERLHLFGSRAGVFADEVLQETLVLVASRPGPCAVPGPDQAVVVSASSGAEDLAGASEYRLDAATVTDGWPGESWLVPRSAAEEALATSSRRLTTRLADLGAVVRTGQVVPHRLAEGARLLADPEPGAVPLLWLHNVGRDATTHPLGSTKAQWYRPAPDEQVPAGPAVVVRRFSAKEERWRVTAALHPARPDQSWAAENHLNVVSGPAPVLAGLAAYLNSSFVDRFLRLYSGHTQVGAVELRELPLLPAHLLAALPTGAAQEELDAAVDAAVDAAGRAP